MINFSPNMINTFVSCPHKYYLKYVEKISVPQNASFFDKGKKIHALANYYLRGENIDKLEKTLNSEEQILWQRLKDNEYFQKTYVNSEYNLSCKIGDYWIGGRIDAVVKAKDNYYILDYKTGAIPKDPEYDFQTIVYLLALKKLLKISSDISFIYIDLKNNKNHTINLTLEKIKEYEQKIIKICDQISKYRPLEEIEHTKKCEFCEYRKICL